MDINEFRRILTAFADEPSDVDIRAGRVVAQIRDDVIDATVRYSMGEDRQLCIEENGLEYSARSWIIKRVARLPQLADRIINNTEATSKSPFVTPSGLISTDLAAGEEVDEKVNDVVEALLKQVTNSVPGATSVLYLTSDAGEGKTTVINRAAQIQAHRYKEKKVQSLLVPIPLSGRSFLTFDDSVIAALVNKLRFNYLYFDAFIELVRIGAVVPAFDGYEEMLVEGSKGEAISALGNLLQKLDSSGSVFVAARKAFFEYLSFRTQARLFDAIGDRSVAFSRLAISRWSEDQFCAYGILRKVDSPDAIYETVSARLSPDHPLLTRAVLVRRLFDVVEGKGQAELVDLLGTNPHDYFFTFVDAIVKREASEKWLARVSGDVMEPLLKPSEHHQLLSQIALEMWHSSTNSLRYDVLDIVVDIYCEALKKGGAVTRQIKERIKQHSLLSTETARGQGVGFDHEDFLSFYLGEALGHLLNGRSRSELHTFLSINLVPMATLEQSIQYMIRRDANLEEALQMIVSINQSEISYSFCKENCGSLAIRLAEYTQTKENEVNLKGMMFSVGALTERALRHIHFDSCHFQPTLLSRNAQLNVEFTNCEFERLELDTSESLTGCTFVECKIDSLITRPDEEQIFDPKLILETLRKAGASLGESDEITEPSEVPDNRVKLLERFLRVFLRHTHVDEDFIRLKLGNKYSTLFFDELLPLLLSERVLEEEPWRGQGVKRRFKLIKQMSEIGDALEKSQGQLDDFFIELR